MNKQLITYLAGPAEKCSWDETHVWRNYATNILGSLNVFNPMKRKYEDKDVQYRDLVEADKNEIYRSDIILANCWKKSVGTSMEMIFAYQLGKLVVTVYKDTEMDPWLKYHSTVMFDNLDKALSYINTLQDRYNSPLESNVIG
jgi:nucleoside 2-deoxyribosyltransferase